jgi:hypothetical protein
VRRCVPAHPARSGRRPRPSPLGVLGLGHESPRPARPRPTLARGVARHHPRRRDHRGGTRMGAPVPARRPSSSTTCSTAPTTTSAPSTYRPGPSASLPTTCGLGLTTAGATIGRRPPRLVATRGSVTGHAGPIRPIRRSGTDLDIHY